MRRRLEGAHLGGWWAPSLAVAIGLGFLGSDTMVLSAQTLPPRDSSAWCAPGGDGVAPWYQGSKPTTYWFRDLGYFRAPRADVRAAHTYAQLVRADTVPRNGVGGQDFDFGGSRSHLEGGFGTLAPIVGRHWAPDTGNACRGARGFVLMVHGAIHTMSDLGSENDVVNSDVSFGGVLAVRPGWAGNRLAFRLRYIHESTHLGDELSIKGTVRHDLQRFDVAYEALDLYASVDNARRAIGLEDTYWRAYLGYRRLGQGLTLGEFDGVAEGIGVQGDSIAVVPPLLYRSRHEMNVGAELLSPLLFGPGTSDGARLFSGHLFAAGEMYLRDRLDFTNPEKVANWFLGLGWLFRNPLVRDWGLEASVRFYSGIHPHGQFRSVGGFRYWAWRVAFNPA